MAREPKRAQSGTTEYLQIRLDGELKNQVIELCERQACSLNAWLVEMVKRAVREERGLPEPPQAVAPIPTPADLIRDYLRGEQTLAPCGKQAPCEGMEVEPSQHDGLEFCSICGIRQL